MADKRKEIMEAAKVLFNRQGYAKTSVDDISQAVGMRKSSLYYYFKNKEDLFMSSFKNEWEAQFKEFQEEAEKETDPPKKIIAYIKQSLNYYEKVVIEHKIPVKALIETRNTYRVFVNQINQGGVAFYVDCIKEGQNAGVFKNCDAQKVGHALFLVKFSIQYDQLSMFIHSSPTENDWNQIHDSIIYAIDLIIDGIRK